MKAGVWILVALTFAAGALAQAPQERPDWKLFFSDQAVDGTIVIADERSGEMLALRCGTCTETVHAGIDF